MAKESLQGIGGLGLRLCAIFNKVFLCKQRNFTKLGGFFSQPAFPHDGHKF